MPVLKKKSSLNKLKQKRQNNKKTYQAKISNSSEEPEKTKQTYRERQDETSKQSEAEINKMRMKEIRQNSTYKHREIQTNADRIKKKRENDNIYVQQEKETNAQRIKEKRKQVDEYASRENQSNCLRMKRKRTEDGEYATKENEKNTQRIRSGRADPAFALNENQANIKRMRYMRDDEFNRDSVRSRDRVARRVQRGLDIMKHRQAVYNKLNEHKSELQSRLLLTFIEKRKQLPKYLCSCCEGAFFEAGVVKVSREKIRLKIMDKPQQRGAFFDETIIDSRILNNYSERRQNYICHTCFRHVEAGNVPKLASSNGLKIPPVPDTIAILNDVEERLLSPYAVFMAFMIMSHKASNPQMGMKGSVVYVPVDVNEMVKTLPRNFNNLNIMAIPVDFKRNLGHSSSYLRGFVRPAVLKNAADYLISTPLYQKYGISVDEGFMDELASNAQSEVFNIKADDPELSVHQNDMDIDDEFYDQLNDGDDACLLFDFNEITAQNTVVVMAPGQNQYPVSPYRNPDIEYLSFPKIFAGQPQILLDKNISIADKIKWELRFHGNKLEPKRVLFLAKTKLFNESLNSVQTSIRKKTNARGVTAAQALNRNFIAELGDHNDGLKFMKNIRCAPAYMQQIKKTLFAFVGQIGTPTFFVTFSAVETNWPELIQGLVEYSCGEKISLASAISLPLQEKSRLVNDYPVFTARYYDNKIKNLMKMITGTTGIFDGLVVTDFFRRREFQQRGSPHDHVLFWIKDAPKIDPDNRESFDKFIEFVDKFITCEYDDQNPFCKYLRHKHTATCSKGKRNKQLCRFNFPKFVMPKTMILEPLPQDKKSAEVKENLAKIKDLMEMFYTNKERIYKHFDDILRDLGLTEDAYLTAIRSSLTRLTMFYKRRSCEVDINTYNKIILNFMESNVDMQPVMDPYGVAAYIMDYVAKQEAGPSKVLRNLQEELNKGNYSLQEKLRCVANKFLNSNVMSSSEAVYHGMGTALTQFSRDSIFLNTGPRDERVVFLKSTKELMALNPESTEICGKDLLTHYSERNGLTDVCLAEYAAYYFRTANKKRPDKNLDSDDEQDNEIELPEIQFDDHHRRKKARIIRHVRYKIGQDPDNYYREQILMFLPWRNEKEEIEDVNWYDKFTEHEEEIEKNRSNLFAISSDRLDNAIDEVNNNRKLIEEEEIEEFEVDIIPKDQEIDIFVHGGIDRPKKKNVPFTYCAPPKIDVANLFEKISKLNTRQMEIVMHIYKCFKTGNLPLRIFIAGSAGVGKSMVISTIYQLITYHLEYFSNNKKGNDSLKVLLSAFSGKAAFLIGGNTLHSAFCLPLQENANMPDLPLDVANNLRHQLLDSRMLIIDEISMVGSTIFSRIDTRLRQIFGVNESFGGLSVIVVGDFLQLSPVKDSSVFLPPKNSLIQMDISPLWNEFYLYELTEVMRQKDDLSFVNALNNFARGAMTDDDINVIKTREILEANVPDEAIRLYYTNADVERYNNKKITASPSAEIECVAIDLITGKLKAQQKRTKLKLWKEKPTKDCGGYPYVVRLKQGIKYMVTANLDVSDGLVNGATGVLEYVYCDPKTKKPKIVFLNFGLQIVGKKMRSQYKNFMENSEINNSWTPIARKTYNLTTHFQRDYQAIRDQFPLVPCEALTIHKSQGQTYESVCLDFRKSGNLTRQLVYVALSRVTKLSGLYIIGTFQGNMKSNNTIETSLKEMQRMQSLRQLSLIYDNLKFTKGLIIVYLNVRSLRTSLKHIKADTWYSRCDVLIFAETCTYPNEEPYIPGFKIMYRSDKLEHPAYVKTNIAKGIMCFTKIETNIEIIKSKLKFKSDNNNKYQSHVDLVHFTLNGASVICGYKSPMTSFYDFKTTMMEMNINNLNRTIVMGDFNFDLNDTTNIQTRYFQSLMTQLMLNDKLPCTEGTTILGSRLDILYSNMDDVKTGIYECYFSDHKPIFIELSDINSRNVIQSISHINRNVPHEMYEMISVGSGISDTLPIEGACTDCQYCLNYMCSDSDSSINTSDAQLRILEWSKNLSRIAVEDNWESVNGVQDVQQQLSGKLNHVDIWNVFDEEHMQQLLRRFKLPCEFTCQYIRQLGIQVYKTDRDETKLHSEQMFENFHEIVITGNGNCQFNSISYAVVGDEGFSSYLRVLAFQSVVENKYEFFTTLENSGILESESMTHLLKTCLHNYQWGNQDTLFALSIKLERRIYIVEKRGNAFKTQGIIPFVTRAPPIVLHLRNAGTGGAHYNVLLPNNATETYDFFNIEYLVLQELLAIET